MARQGPLCNDRMLLWLDGLCCPMLQEAPVAKQGYIAALQETLVALTSSNGSSWGLCDPIVGLKWSYREPLCPGRRPLLPCRDPYGAIRRPIWPGRKPWCPFDLIVWSLCGLIWKLCGLAGGSMALLGAFVA